MPQKKIFYLVYGWVKGKLRCFAPMQFLHLLVIPAKSFRAFQNEIRSTCRENSKSYSESFASKCGKNDTFPLLPACRSSRSEQKGQLSITQTPFFIKTRFF